MDRRRTIVCLVIVAALSGGLTAAGHAQTAGRPATPVPPPTAVPPKGATPAAPPKDTPPLAPRGAWLPLPVLPRPLSAPVLTPSAPIPVTASPTPAARAPAAAPPQTAEPKQGQTAEPKRGQTAEPKRGDERPQEGGAAIAAGRDVWATAGIYIRAEASSNGRVLDTLEKGQRAQALTAPDAGGWVRIARGGRPVGWVAAAHLTPQDPDSASPAPSAPSAAVPPPPKSDTAPAPQAASCLGPSPVPSLVAEPGTRMRVTADTRIRREPSCDSPAIDVIDGGAVVTVLGGGGDGWYRVRGAGWDGVYLAAKLLAPLRR